MWSLSALGAFLSLVPLAHTNAIESALRLSSCPCFCPVATAAASVVPLLPRFSSSQPAPAYACVYAYAIDNHRTEPSAQDRCTKSATSRQTPARPRQHLQETGQGRRLLSEPRKASRNAFCSRERRHATLFGHEGDAKRRPPGETDAI